MATYIARNAQGEQVNLVEIEPEQIAKWEALTGLRLELLPESKPDSEPNVIEMERALNLLGVATRDE